MEKVNGKQNIRYKEKTNTFQTSRKILIVSKSEKERKRERKKTEKNTGN